MPDTLNSAQLSFIGCGVMAEAIIAGLLKKNLVSLTRLLAAIREKSAARNSMPSMVLAFLRAIAKP